MQITSETQGDRRILALHGRLDASTAPELEARLDTAGVRELILDLAGCPYVSSAGIRSILLAHRRVAAAGGTLVARNPTPAVLEVFNLTGLSKVVTLARTAREISLDGCELLSSGVCGECFRLDAETVVKLYKDGVDIGMAEQEKKYAKAAFVLGIPTAISYDVVTCGSRSGIVFELLNAELFSAVIRREPERIDLHAKRLADLATGLHAAKGDPAVLPPLKDRIRDYINRLGGVFAPAEISLLLERLDAVPDADGCVHFDLHSSNIMVQDGELVIIDMGDFSIGSNFFDIGLIYMIYGVPELGMCQLATKIDAARGVEFWESFVAHYFAGRPPEEREFFDANRYFLASLRIVCAISYLPHIRDELIRLVKEVLFPRIALEARAAEA
jgi:uncharacterized protein (TIGR02172 family)